MVARMIVIVLVGVFLTGSWVVSQPVNNIVVFSQVTSNLDESHFQ